MDSYILAQAEGRIRKLEAEVLQLRNLEALRYLSDEQGKFFRKSAFTVVGGMATLGLFFTLLARLG